MDHFFLPLLLKGVRAGWARILRIPRLVGADLQGVIASGGEVL